jgi:hypothetical protein
VYFKAGYVIHWSLPHVPIGIVYSTAFSYLLLQPLRLLLPYAHALIVDAGLADMGSVVFFASRLNSGIAAALGYLALLVLGRMLFRHRLAADLVAALTFNAFAFGALWVGTFEQRLLLTFLFLIPR